MTKEEAREYLESLDFCLTHFVRQERTARKLICPECEKVREEVQARKIALAVAVMRGNVAALPTESDWIPCAAGSLPRPGQRVLVAVKGFIETGRAGGKERWTLGSTPLFWKREQT